MSGRNCIEEIVLSAYLDGELPEDALKKVEEHLLDCRDCNAAYERMKADHSLLLECLPDAIPPEHMKLQLFRKINAAPETSRRSGILSWAGIGRSFPFQSRAWTYACASIVLLAFIITAFQIQRRLEDAKILAEIDRSGTEWAARDYSVNPFNIVYNGIQSQITAKNPFKSYLNER